MKKIQTSGKYDYCSSVGDIEKHEKFKKLKMEERIAKLQEVYDKYGVYSNEFFVQVKPFIMWACYRNMRGMNYTYLEDLVNNAYDELIIAFEGGYTTHYNIPVYKEKKFGTKKYLDKQKNIGKFVLDVVASSVVKYRSKNYSKHVIHENADQDISDRLNYTDFEINHDLDYTINENYIDEDLFTHFKFNDILQKHIETLKETSPRNNVLYNYILWRQHI